MGRIAGREREQSKQRGAAEAPADWHSKDMFVSECRVESTSSESSGPGAKALGHEEAMKNTQPEN